MRINIQAEKETQIETKGNKIDIVCNGKRNFKMGDNRHGIIEAWDARSFL